MSSLFATTKKAEVLYAIQNYDAATATLALARETIRQHWPKPGEYPFAICCFTTEGPTVQCEDEILETDFENKTISVKKRVPLYRAKPEERKALCAMCRKDCRERLSTLAQALANRKQASTP